MYGWTEDLTQTYNDTLAQAKDRGTLALMFGVAFFLGVAFLMKRAGR